MSLAVARKRPGTMYEGLFPDERPEQGCSPLPYLSLNELVESSRAAWSRCYASVPVAASRTARSDEGARTDRLAATAAEQPDGEYFAGFDFSFSDLRRCSTADQSRLRDFEDFRDGH